MDENKAEALTAALEAYTAKRVAQVQEAAHNAGIRTAYLSLLREAVGGFKCVGTDKDAAQAQYDKFEAALSHLRQTCPWLDN